MSDQEDPMRTTVKPVHPWTTLGEQKPTRLSSRRSTCWVIVATWVVTHVLLFWSLYRKQTVTTVDADRAHSLGITVSLSVAGGLVVLWARTQLFCFSLREPYPHDLAQLLS